MSNPLIKAINQAGGQKALADRIGTTQSMVWYWLMRAKKGVPPEVAIRIERATEGAVSRADLRPDIFAVDEVTA
ncbi:transcriptional regulator [Rhodoligotrophos ferricapiens]|uniref:transcriptional regulator n=1 Tax=Rhodoligotrophos ferricapiens TaxID=3069264 RepID=UPI00315DA6CD